MFSVPNLAILDVMSLCSLHKQPPLTQLTFTLKSYEIDFSGMLSSLVPAKWSEDLRPVTLFEHDSADSSTNQEPS
ncbi:MAG: hypothetical protein U0236_21155 [Nitrospira sp.]